MQVLEGDVKNGEGIISGTTKGAAMSTKDIRDTITAAKTQKNMADTSVSDNEVSAFIAENNINVSDDTGGWEPEKTIDASSKWSLFNAFQNLPQSVRRDLSESGAHPHRKVSGTAWQKFFADPIPGTKVPTEAKLREHLTYVITQGGRGGQFHKAMLKYIDNLRDVEVEDLERKSFDMRPAEVQSRAKEIQARYERLRTYRP